MSVSEDNEKTAVESGSLTHLADAVAITIFALLLFVLSGITPPPEREKQMTTEADVTAVPVDEVIPPPEVAAAPIPAAEAVSKPAGMPTRVAKKMPPERKTAKAPEIQRRLPPLSTITQVSEAGKKLAVTFDGGSSDASAEAILDILSARGIRTTFFLTGLFIKRYPALVQRMVEEGHEVGNHTYSHPHLTTFSRNGRPETAKGIDSEFLKGELETTAALYRELTGRDMAPLWRAPFGEINGEITAWAEAAGYRHIGWTADRKKKINMDSLDWVSDRHSTLYLTAVEIKERLLAVADGSGRADGGIILMHLGTEREEEIVHERLGEIIDGLAEKGYEIVPVSRLLEEKKG